jgi:UDP-N-acetyl-2-amino-2-deoxyglucuronate dehydrogenase
MSKTLQFAIIGCGRIAQRHAEHINKVGKLIATCDIIPEKAKSLAEPYKACAYSDLGEMLSQIKDVEVISVCSPNGLHAEHTIKSLQAGFHVLCEKPMALTVQDCGDMITAAERANKRLFIVKQNRFNPPVAAVKKVIEEGKLGKIYSVQLNCFWNRNEAYYKNSWKGTKSLDGGTLFTQFSHFIDLLYWMIGDIKDASGFGGNLGHQHIIEFEDTGVVSVRFYNGAIGTINYTVNSFGQNMEGSLTIFGEKGTVKIGGQYLNELEYQNIENYKIENLPPGNPPNNYGQYQGSMSNHDKVYANLLEVLQGNGIIATNGFEGLKTVEIIDKIYSNTKQV